MVWTSAPPWVSNSTLNKIRDEGYTFCDHQNLHCSFVLCERVPEHLLHSHSSLSSILRPLTLICTHWEIMLAGRHEWQIVECPTVEAELQQVSTRAAHCERGLVLDLCVTLLKQRGTPVFPKSLQISPGRLDCAYFLG